MDRQIRPFDSRGGDMEQEDRQDTANHIIATYSGLTDSILTAYRHTWWSLLVGTGLSLLLLAIGIFNRLDQPTVLLVTGSIVGCFLVSLIVTNVIVRIRLGALDREYDKRLRQL